MILIVGLTIFSLIILIHELGHYLVGLLFGVKFTSFSIGMGPRILRKKINDTIFCISILPIGGYVRPVSEANVKEPRESFASKIQRFLAPIDKEEGEILSKYNETSPGNILSMGFWPQFLFAIGGVAFNLLSIIIVTFIYLLYFSNNTIYEDSPLISHISHNSMAKDAGFEIGDQIVKIDGKEFKSWRLSYNEIKRAKSPQVIFEVKKVGANSTTELKLYKSDEYLKNNISTFFEKAGFSPSYRELEVTPLVALNNSIVVLKNLARDFFKMVLSSSNDSANNRVDEYNQSRTNNGPITGIFEAGYIAVQSYSSAVTIFIVCSFIAAVLNLLPLPALDGGHILFLIIERCFKIPISYSTKISIQRFGFCSIMLLIIALLVRDLIISNS